MKHVTRLIIADTSNDLMITTWERINNGSMQCVNGFLKISHLIANKKLHNHCASQVSAKFKEQQHQRNHRRECRQPNIVGDDIAIDDNRIQWNNATTVFNNRIKTEIIRNLEYIDLFTFFWTLIKCSSIL
ncbi:hypothetical protein PV327_008764 [Microctonus hyperodae]|uniref:Uncharacterized protein n=1 Tax=Microctonus hyperodae TaxID=165561 RepID=A0AA39FSQ0_MICHY|nr:hypothetical protein PV327_008764 [Microctonus hyperodae]